MHQRTLGVDLGVKSRHVAVVWQEEGQKLIEVLRFELLLEELGRVERAAMAGAAEGTKLHVVMEKTYPAYQYVSQFFLGRGHRVSYAKPDQVKEGRKFLWRKVKTDERDALVMARLPYLDPRQLTRAHVAKACVEELKTLVRQRLSLVKQSTSLKNLLDRSVNAVWPGVTEVLDLDSNHGRALIRALVPQRAAELGEAGLLTFIREKGRVKRAHAQRLAIQLVVVAKRAVELQSIFGDDNWIELERVHAMEVLEQIEGLERTLASKEQQIEQAYVKADPNQIFKTVPGVGDRTAPSFFSYFGEPERFPTTRKAQGFVGLYPATDSSGQKDRKGTALSKQGPGPLRRDLYLATDHFRRQDPQGAWVYYDQMVNKGKHHISALCIVANRVFIPRLMAVARQRRAYELRDLEGHPINKEQARELAAQFRVPEEVRARLRNLKKVAHKKNRGSVSSPVTSEHEAPRSETAPRQHDSTKEQLTLTKAELATLVDQLLKSGGNLGEINLGSFK